MATISPAEIARMRVVYEVPGMDRVEVRRNRIAARTIEFIRDHCGAAAPAPEAGASR